MRQLISPMFIDLRIYNYFTGNNHLDGIVQEGAVHFGGGVAPMKFNVSDLPYADGTLVKVKFLNKDSGFVCQSMAEFKAEKMAMEQVRELARIEYEQALTAKIAETKAKNKAFNESLNIPVLWTPEIKIVHAGLTFGSNSSDHNRRTVYHIVLLEPLNEGRLKRNAYQPLCGGDLGNFGDMVESKILSGRIPPLESNRVTCRACLKIAERWHSK